jgi:glyoxylase-like metal-dependent hydrolase (beta-lactamase superfamily II)
LIVTGAISMAAVGFQGQGQSSGPAPAPLPRPKLEIQKVKDNFYLIPTGSSPGTPGVPFVGGNTVVWVTANGVVVVDTKLAGWGGELLSTIKTVTDKPVTTIINTHTHYDHTGSNTEFPANIEFVVHENTKANLAKETCAPVINCQSFKGDNAKYLPKKTFKDKMSLFSGKDQIDLYYFGVGHTNGDAWVVFPAVRFVHVGDMCASKSPPFIDRGSGGSMVSFPTTLSKAIAGIKNVDNVVGGHQDIFPFKELEDYQHFTQDILTGAQTAMKGGKTVDEAVATITPTLEKYKDKRFDLSRGIKAQVQAAYDELSGK